MKQMMRLYHEGISDEIGQGQQWIHKMKDNYGKGQNQQTAAVPEEDEVNNMAEEINCIRLIIFVTTNGLSDIVGFWYITFTTTSKQCCDIQML